MAYVNTTRAPQSTLADRIGNFFTAMKAAFARRRIYDQTVRELRMLSDLSLIHILLSHLFSPRCKQTPMQDQDALNVAPLKCQKPGFPPTFP